jgi:hypothetical protein
MWLLTIAKDIIAIRKQQRIRAVCTENLGPEVVVMKSAQNGM